MRIGVDARLLREPVTGIGRALLEIGTRLSAINPDIIFYTPGGSGFNNLLNIHSCSLGDSFVGGRIFEHLWAQTILPMQAKIDQIDVFWGPAHRLPFLLSSSIAQVLTIHDLVWISHPETMHFFGCQLEKVFMPYSLHHADKVMAISKSTERSILQEFPVIKPKLTTISLGSSSFQLKPNLDAFYRLEISRKYILFVGTLEPRKNLNRLIEAYSRLSPDLRSQYDLVLVGSGGWRNLNLANLIESHGLSESIKMVGYVSDKDLASLYHHATFLAMPSLSEGFGLPILEAMSAGIPVLTSNCSSMTEISGDAALFIDPLSIDSIQGGLERLLTDSQLRISLSANAHKNAMKYSWDKCAGDLMNLFEEAVTSHKVKKL